MKKQVEEWMFFANHDLSAAERLLQDDDSLTTIVAFHCQQAIEKCFKAFLIENDVPLKRTHDLIRLNEMIKGIRDFGIDEKRLAVINDVYFDSRYPGEFGLMPNGMPSREQAEDFIRFAQEVRTKICSEWNL